MNQHWLILGLVAYGVVVLIFTIFAVVIYVQNYAKKEKKIAKGKIRKKR